MSQMEVPDEVSSEFGPGVAWFHPNAAAAISAFVDRGPYGVAVIDTEFRFLLVSQGLAVLHGQEVSSTVGKRVDEVLPAPFGSQVRRRLQEVLASGAPMIDAQTWGTFADPRADRSFTSSFYRLDATTGVPLGVVVLITETTDLRRAATAASSAEAQLDLLRRVTEALSSGRAVADVTQVALLGAAEAVGASAAVLMVLDHDNLVPMGSTGLSDGTLAFLREPSLLDAQLPHCDALRSRTIQVWGSKGERDTEYPHLVSYSADHQSWAFVPLLSKDVGVGVMMFAWRLDRSFGETDLALLAGVGRQCALALEQARILDAERDARRAMEFLVEVTKFVVEGSEEGVYALSAGNRILTFNRRFCELMGLPESAIQVGADANEVLAHCISLAADPEREARRLAASRERPFDHLTFDLALKDGRVMACNSSPIVDRRNVALGRVWYLRDETERRAQEAEQRVVLEELQAHHEHQSFLLEAAEIVAQAEGYAETLERLAAVAVPTLADLCLVDTLTWDGRIVRMAARHADRTAQPLVDELGSNYAPDPAGSHPSIEVIHTGRARWSATMSDEFLRRTSRDDHHFELLKRLGFTSYMTVPLVAESRILGSVTLVSAGSGRRFGPEDLVLADEFTSCVAQVVAAAHRHDVARHAAQTLQASLLPDHLPDVPGLALAVRYLPATLDSDVGGDFYDVIRDSSDVVTIVIGDVAGHDMQAAAVMGKVRTAVRVLAGQATGPRHFVEMLRRGWDNLELERMATLLVAQIDARNGELRMVSAGHPPPLLVDDDHAEFVDVKPTTPLGAPRSPIHEWRGSLPSGATLLLFTDGLVEDRHRTFEEGAAELQHAAGGRFEPDELCDHVLEAMVDDNLHHDDDIALVAVSFQLSPHLVD
jgi:serine phosphatase RsbU (regulator of sigma subunit)/PAS domain-containing protein